MVPVIYMLWINEETMQKIKRREKAISPADLRRGFTLMEVLVAVMILAILIAMSVPMYERAVEKSRVAEVSALLKRISESKLRTMDSMGLTTFTASSFGLSQLDVTVPSSEDFTYSLYPSSYPNAVCAKRSRGDNAGTLFLYLGETAPEYCASANSDICNEYRASGRKLFCQNKSGTTSCESYGLNSYSVGTCN